MENSSTIYRSDDTKRLTCRICGGHETHTGDRPICVHDTVGEYLAKVATFERDARTVTGTDREILAVCAGQFATQLEGALWSGDDARSEGLAIASRARRVEQTLLAQVLDA